MCEAASQPDVGQCTNTANEGRRVPFIAILLPVVATSLQGCLVNIPKHKIANWLKKNNYMITYEYLPPGRVPGAGTLNSCNQGLPPSMVCSGHGSCRDWFDAPLSPTASANRLAFCQCEKEWTDPECRTRRKSQITALSLSVLFGLFGADQFYLGYAWLGFFKLITFGGFGIWYLFDIVRIGSSSVLTLDRFRVTEDMNRWAFVLLIIVVTGFWGFLLSIISIYRQRLKKARELMLLKLEMPDAQGFEPQKIEYAPPSTPLPARELPPAPVSVTSINTTPVNMTPVNVAPASVVQVNAVPANLVPFNVAPMPTMPLMRTSAPTMQCRQSMPMALPAGYRGYGATLPDAPAAQLNAQSLRL